MSAEEDYLSRIKLYEAMRDDVQKHRTYIQWLLAFAASLAVALSIYLTSVVGNDLDNAVANLMTEERIVNGVQGRAIEAAGEVAKKSAQKVFDDQIDTYKTEINKKLDDINNSVEDGLKAIPLTVERVAAPLVTKAVEEKLKLNESDLLKMAFKGEKGEKGDPGDVGRISDEIRVANGFQTGEDEIILLASTDEAYFCFLTGVEERLGDTSVDGWRGGVYCNINKSKNGWSANSSWNTTCRVRCLLKSNPALKTD